MASPCTAPPCVRLLPQLLRALPAPGRQICSLSSGAASKYAPSSVISPSRVAASRVDSPRCAGPQLREHGSLSVDWGTLAIADARADDELRAAVRLRVRSFYEFNQSFDVEGHREYVVDREFEALKERIAGEKTEFRRVSCLNATLPLTRSLSSADDLCVSCGFSDNGQQKVVVGTLDLNQCLLLAGELTGKRPEETGKDMARAYLSNVCVAKELHRNGLGRALILRSKKVAKHWGITDLYVHVAVDNEAAKKLYEKAGFIYESEEPAWQARFLGRPRRFLLWNDLTQADDF